jgi:transcriptional regulator with XRE-family HTH domain
MAKAKKAPPARPDSRASGPLDKALGDKIRARRLMAKMNQAELANHLGVSFQQVQKYETGANRVTAVRLEQIAKAFGESVTYFQDDGSTISKAGREMQTLITDPINLRACKALSAIDNQAMRFQWVRLLEAFSGIRTNDD